MGYQRHNAFIQVSCIKLLYNYNIFLIFSQLFQKIGYSFGTSKMVGNLCANF